MDIRKALQHLAVEGSIPLKDGSDSHVRQCAYISVQSLLSYAWDDWSHLHIAKNATGYKFRQMISEMRLTFCRGVGLCDTEACCGFVCCVYVLQGCPSAVCLGWIRGACCRKSSMTGWAFTAHKKVRSRRVQACLYLQIVNLISHCTDTSIIVIKQPE